jgi:transposase
LGKQRRYTEEFKTEAVRLARTSSQSIRQTALDLGVSNQTLGTWIREGHAGPGVGPLTTDERAELAELRRRVKVLETEREILRKAAAFFAQETERTR